MRSVLAALFAFIGAVSFSAQSPISEYLYVGDHATNLVKGVVMGDGGDYYAMRYEDILFLQESFHERLLLSTGFASSNAYKSALHGGPVVLPNAIGSFQHMPLDYFVDPTVRLSSIPKYLTGTVEHVVGFTNVTSNVTATVTISQQMTNGTLDVHSSSYSFSSNVSWEVVTTNLDISEIQGGIRNLVFRENPFTVYDRRVSQLQDHEEYRVHLLPYSRSFITNLYSAVRECRRPLPMDADYLLYNENDLWYNRKIVREYRLTGDDRGTPPLIRTSQESGGPSYYISIDTEYTEKLGERATYDDESGGWFLAPFIETNAYKTVATCDPIISSFLFRTRIPKIAEEYAGRRIITSLYPYIGLKINHSLRTQIGYSTNTNHSNYATETVESNDTFKTVFQLGLGERKQEDSEMVEFYSRSSINDYIKTAIQGFGLNLIDHRTDPEQLIPRNSGEVISSRHEASGLVEWYRNSSVKRHESFEMRSPSLIYVMDLKPRTTLSTWNEY